jgi:Dyp-type peroxidase family
MIRQVSKQRATTLASKNLIHSAELAVLVPVKAGLVETSSPMTYARRLELLLEALFDLRKEGVEKSRESFVGPLEQLRTIHHVHWCVFDDGPAVYDDTSPNKKLLLVVSFDQPWEPYIRVIVDKAGPLLDLIFCHCQGFEGFSSKDGYEKFAQFVRKGQQECQYFAGAHPELSVDDQRYLKQFRDLQAGSHPDELPLRAVVQSLVPRRPAVDEGDRLFRLLGELYKTRRMFPDNRKPKDASGRAPITDQQYYDAAARLLIRGFLPLDLEHHQFTLELLTKFTRQLGAQYRGIVSWYKQQIESIDGLRIRADALKRREIQEAPEAIKQRLQWGILPERNRTTAAMTHGCLVMLQLTGTDAAPSRAAAEFLKALHALAKMRDASTHCNVAFTYAGLRKLLDHSILQSLPVEFQVGMEERAGLLGDLGENHPSRWSLPKVNHPASAADGNDVPLSTVDLVVLLQTHHPASSQYEKEGRDYLWTKDHPLYSEVDKRFSGSGVRVLHVEPLRRYLSRRVAGGYFREHFGYVDGFSDPDVFAGNGVARALRAALGDFLLGHRDSRGEKTPFPSDVRDGQRPSPSRAFNEGSFLVVRKLKQDVEAFEGFLSEQATMTGVPERTLRAKLMGRSADGAPLALKAAATPANNAFDYDEDREGVGCPLQAHVRRANPRTIETPSVHGVPTQTPRLLRHGFPYGPESGNEHERGLMFMAYNSRIAEQYEVIQRWINGGNPTGLYSDQNDPIVGAGDPSRPRRFTFRDTKEAKSITIERPFVKLQWGLYLFSPSLVGLEELAAFAEARSAQATAPEELDQVEIGERIIENLRRIEREAALDAPPARNQPLGGAASKPAEQEWKVLLEDEGLQDDALAVWAAIRKLHGGVLATPYGILVGSQEHALTVLSNEELFSVREYYSRMARSFGVMHLGMDKRPVLSGVCPGAEDAEYERGVAGGDVDYARDSFINDEITRISTARAFQEARTLTFNEFAAAAARARPPSEAPLPTLDLAVLGERVVGLLAASWFGCPDRDELPLKQLAALLSEPSPGANPEAPTLRISGTPEDTQIGEGEGGEETRHPDGNAYCPHDFIVASQYVFRPNPDPWAKALAKERGEAIQAAVGEYLKATPPGHPFLQLLEAKAKANTELGSLKALDEHSFKRRALVGAIDGFVGATYGSFVSVIDQWLEDDELRGHQFRFEEELSRFFGKDVSGLGEETFDSALPDGFKQQVYQKLLRRAVPPWVYRRALRCTQLGDVPIKGGSDVIVNLASAAKHEPYMLFGGRRPEPDVVDRREAAYGPVSVEAAVPRVCPCVGGPDAEQAAAQAAVKLEPSYDIASPIHACPGRKMALGAIYGMLSAILMQRKLRREGRLLISFELVKGP